MDRAHLAALLSPYGVNQFESFRVVDSSKPNDYRLNIIVDRGYVLASIGHLSQAYSGVDLQPVFSMWSIIDLAPLDVEIDEKQDNLSLLVQALCDAGAGPD